jgi:glycosyltransferase involved in cell wall biosynthesis
VYVFLTACRNEEKILPDFLAEFTAMVEKAGIAAQTRLYVVDDLSVDRSVEILEDFARAGRRIEVRVIRAPTNLGNQGAMFYGLRQIEVGPSDVLITFDCDGEDDVEQIPSIIEMGAQNAGKVVLIERGRRRESALFKVYFAVYKLLFRFFTRQSIIPNNFLLIPGGLVPAIQCSPLAAVHFAYAILKLRPPSVSTTRDRRSRYGGRTSQNVFMLVSHGLVGLMLFYEVVVAKIFTLLFAFGAFAAAVVGLAIFLPADWVAAQRTLIWSAIAAGVTTVGLFGLLLSAALALIFKLAAFTLAAASAVNRASGALPGRPPAGGEADRTQVDVTSAGRKGVLDRV